MGAYAQTYTTNAAAPVDACFAVLTDFADYPRWSSPIAEARIVSRYRNGMPKRVAFVLEMPIRTVRYTLEYTWTPPRGGTWRMVEGDVAGIEGEYRFEAAPGGASVTCRQEIDLGFWIPGFVRSAFEEKALRDSVEEFRRAAEERARA